MRNLIGVLSLAAGSLILSGAAPPLRNAKGERPPERVDLAAVKSIRFCCGQSGGIPGAARDEYLLELSARGPCRATVVHGNNWDSNARTTTYDLPAGTFAKLQKALIASDFFAMKSVSPDVPFEDAQSWVTVACDGEFEHGVSVIGSVRAPAGFRELFALGQSVEKDGKPAGEDTLPVAHLPPLPRRR